MKNNLKMWIAIMIAVSLVVGCFPGNLGVQSVVKAEETINNPRILVDDSMRAGQRVTWDCVWFGSYPQTEIVDKAETSGMYGNNWGEVSDFVVDSAIYSDLQNASGWDNNGDVTINGTKYRRIKQEDITNKTSEYYEFNWSDSATYHYFRFEPIKWRVLNKDGSTALLLADKTLDTQQYHAILEDVTWETSTIRSWLNGYDGASNKQNTDYSGKNFIDTAFTPVQQEGILTTNLENADDTQFGTDGGNDTHDKIFFISKSDFRFETAVSYGFAPQSNSWEDDEAKRCQSSSYAKAMGTWNYYSGSICKPIGCRWWLRSPGYYQGHVNNVYEHGSFGDTNANSDNHGVRPALRLDLSFLNLYSYAGKVCSDGTESQASGSCSGEFQLDIFEKINDPRKVADESMEIGQKVTWDCVWFGSYPQTEIVDKADTCGTYAQYWGNIDDYEVNTSVYNALKNATGWDNLGDITLNGIKYRRIKKSDVTYENSEKTGFYKWNDSETYHYFRYEPIKWRVLDREGTMALLISDRVLDDQAFHLSRGSVTWVTSTIRSWLNGYGAETNQENKDFTNNNFIDASFTPAQQEGIHTLNLININYTQSSTDGRNNTKDKVFFLTEGEVYGGRCYSYGFMPEPEHEGISTADEARRCQSSTYAKAMGIYTDECEKHTDYCNWWLRSSSKYAYDADCVTSDGRVRLSDYSNWTGWNGVRPSLALNLVSSDIYTYAGTVCSDGTVNEIGGSGSKTSKKIKVKKITLSGISHKIAAGKKLRLKATVYPKTATNKKLKWTSSNKKLATVTQTGLVKIKKRTGGKTVRITAKAKDGSGRKAVWKIKIMKGAVKKIKIKGYKKTLKAGKTMKLKAIVKTTKGKPVNKKLKWTTSNKKYATVTQKGLVKAKPAGKGKTVKIKVMSTDGTNKSVVKKIKIK